MSSNFKKFSSSVFSFPTSVKIRKIKEKLVSRNEKDIIEAGDNVLKFLDDGCFVQDVLKSDIPVLLSEAVLPGHIQGNKIVYKCLRAFCNQKLFYSDGHALIVMQAACRSGMFLLNSEDENNDEGDVLSELDCVLLLLNEVFAGYEIFRVFAKNIPIVQLNEFIVALTNKTFNSINTRYHAAVLLNTFLSNEKLKILEKSSGMFVENFIRYFEGMAIIAELVNMSPVIDQIIDVTCSLAQHLSKCLKRLEEKSQEMVKNALIVFLVEQAAPHFMKMQLNYFEKNSRGLVAMFQCIDTLLDEDGKKLSQQLVAAKLLSLVPTLLFNAQKWENDVLINSARTILWKLLAFVALDVFPFPLVWPEGEENFLEEVKSGVFAAPVDPAHWLAALGDSTTHRSVKLVVLLFLYFFVLTEGSLNEMKTYTVVAKFIEDLNPVASRAIFVKMIWLILAVSDVSDVIDPDPDEVILKLSLILESFNDLDLVYTHHPILLFYVMASRRFSSSMQYHVVRLWLIHQTDEDGSVFSEFLKTSTPGKLITLELVQSGDSKVLQKAFHAIHSLLIDTKDREISALVWKILPMACAKICGNAMSPNNFVKIAELALHRIPDLNDSYQKSRTMKLFPAAVASLESPGLTVWQLAHRLMIHFLSNNDFYVVTCYIQSEAFVEKLLENFKADCCETVEICFKIAACLSNVQRREDIPSNDFKVPLSLQPILQQLQSKDNNVRHASLLFVHEILEAKWCPNLCRLINPPETTALRLLFLLIIDVAMIDRSGEGFRCLKTFLKFCLEDGRAFEHFIRERCLLVFIKNSLAFLTESEAIADFLLFWYSVREKIVENSRRLSTPFESIVIVNLAEEIFKSFRPFMMPLVEKLIEGTDLCGTDLYEKLASIAVVLDEEEDPQSLASEPMLDFETLTDPQQDTEENFNLFESMHSPQMEFKPKIHSLQKNVEIVDLTDLDHEIFTPKERNQNLKRIFDSPDLFDSGNGSLKLRRRKKVCDEELFEKFY